MGSPLDVAQRLRVLSEEEPPPPFPALDATTVARLRLGGAFVFDQPDGVPAVWGHGDQVLWAEGEALWIVGPPGVGKTTLTGQLVRGRLGLAAEVVAWPITPGARNVLYLAMDRPRQIARALRRHFTVDERDVLDERLRVWAGPPPVDVARHPEILVELAEEADADTLVVDSVKDAAIGLVDDEVGASFNRAVQAATVAGVECCACITNAKRRAETSRAGSRTSTGRPGSPRALEASSCSTARPATSASTSPT